MMSPSVLRTLRMRDRLLLCLLCAATNCHSLPGKPALLSCRSPEKETFTCRWRPGSDGGLGTTYRLFYERERLKGSHECPDYLSAGENSCFFDKKHTCIWVDYTLTVVASNRDGNVTSDALKFDVMDIVQPDPPINVTARYEDHNGSSSLQVNWNQPDNTDTGSGWVTIKYLLRVGRKDTNNWEEYESGKRTHFTLYSVVPGTVYAVQVRGRLDYGSWSEWSDEAFVDVPDKDELTDQPLWITVCVVSTVAFFAFFWCNFVKNVKWLLLPPVPGPKIRGLDVQLLKSGRYEDIVSALIPEQSFPLRSSEEEQPEDYLVVTEGDDAPENYELRKSFTSSCLEPSAPMEPEKEQKHRPEVVDRCHPDVYVDGSWTFPKSFTNVRTQEGLQDYYSRVRAVTSDSLILLENTCQDLRMKHEAATPTEGVYSTCGYVCAAPEGSL